MSRRVVNIVMFLLAVAYTIFVAVHLVSAICAHWCDDRMTFIISYGVGTLCGIALIIAFIRYYHKRRQRSSK